MTTISGAGPLHHFNLFLEVRYREPVQIPAHRAHEHRVYMRNDQATRVSKQNRQRAGRAMMYIPCRHAVCIAVIWILYIIDVLDCGHFPPLHRCTLLIITCFQGVHLTQFEGCVLTWIRSCQIPVIAQTC